MATVGSSEPPALKMDFAFHFIRVSSHPPQHSPKRDGGGDGLIAVNPTLKQVVLAYRLPVAEDLQPLDLTKNKIKKISPDSKKGSKRSSKTSLYI